MKITRVFYNKLVLQSRMLLRCSIVYVQLLIQQESHEWNERSLSFDNARVVDHEVYSRERMSL